MVTSSDLKFWCGLDVSEEDAAGYTAAVACEFAADGGLALPPELQTEALCYLTAAKIANKDTAADLQSESLGGYSYTRKSSASSSRWLDLYRELLARLSAVPAGLVKRADVNMVQMNRRYGNVR